MNEALQIHCPSPRPLFLLLSCHSFGGNRGLALLTALLESDPGFGAAQRQQQQQYGRYCQALKRSQRYPVRFSYVDVTAHVAEQNKHLID